MKKFIKYAVGIIIPPAAGGLSALLTSGQMQAFEEISKPAFSPPAFLFPVAWSILYVCYCLRKQKPDKKKSARRLRNSTCRELFLEHLFLRVRTLLLFVSVAYSSVDTRPLYDNPLFEDKARRGVS